MKVRSKAPLRLGFGGGGTDVSPYSETFGGFVLNATVDLHAYCTLELAGNDRIELHAADLGERFESAAVSELPLDGPLRLHQGIYNRIVRQCCEGRPLALRLTTHADVVAGSGLGTSSTMVVAIVQAFNEALKLGLGEYEVARLAYEVERREVGLSGGKQDQYAAAFGGFNFMEFSQGDRVIVNPLRVKDWIVNELEMSLVLFHTGRSRESARIIDEQVAHAREPGSESLLAMHRLKEDAVRMKELLLTGELAEFARVLGRSWEAKKKLALSVSNAGIDRIFESALAAGAHAGKVSGAGGGGVIMFMVDPRRRNAVLEALGRSEGRVIPFHFTQRGAESWRPEPAARALNGALAR
jgi:D-glycero-alpha-D-manno-heptose-7-phosphate kinase